MQEQRKNKQQNVKNYNRIQDGNYKCLFVDSFILKDYFFNFWREPQIVDDQMKISDFHSHKTQNSVEIFNQKIEK